MNVSFEYLLHSFALNSLKTMFLFKSSVALIIVNVIAIVIVIGWRLFDYLTLTGGNK